MKRWAAILVFCGCTVGVRAQGVFEHAQPLANTRAVLMDLPNTPVAVFGCDGAVESSCPNTLQVAGRWHAIGGTESDARRNAGSPSIRFETREGLLRVFADIPLGVEGLVDLELEDVVVPDAVDLDVRTALGDVTLEGMRSVLVVDVERGDVDIRGEMRSTGVHVEAGRVAIVGSGPVDVEVGRGGVYIEQTAGAADTRVLAPRGDVELWLGDDTDVDLRVHTPGGITVQTDAFSAATRGHYRARSGDGSVAVEIEAGGDVAVRLRR